MDQSEESQQVGESRLLGQSASSESDDTVRATPLGTLGQAFSELFTDLTNNDSFEDLEVLTDDDQHDDILESGMTSSLNRAYLELTQDFDKAVHLPNAHQFVFICIKMASYGLCDFEDYGEFLPLITEWMTGSHNLSEAVELGNQVNDLTYYGYISVM